jgi:hypothetical protein
MDKHAQRKTEALNRVRWRPDHVTRDLEEVT